MKKSFEKNKFLDLLNKHKGLIYKVAFLYTDTKLDREDLYQEICLQLWRSFKSFNDESKFSTWMYRVAINTAISQIRKNKKSQAVFTDYSVFYEDQSNHETNDQIQLLFSAISKLNKIDKAIILLWLEEKSYEDIAEIIGISKSNVSVKLVRIKKALSDKLKGEFLS